MNTYYALALSPVFIRTYTLAVSLPSGISTTLNNFATAIQVIGGAVALVILGIAAVQMMIGGRNSIEMSKNRLLALIVGMILLAGGSVIKTWIDSMMAF